MEIKLALFHISRKSQVLTIVLNTMRCCQVLRPTKKETSYSYQTRDLFYIIPTKLNTFLSPLLWRYQATQKM